MWNAERPRYLDILLFRQDLRNCRGIFPVFSFEQGLCWKLVAGNCVCWVTWVRWVEGVSGYELRVTGTSGCECPVS